MNNKVGIIKEIDPLGRIVIPKEFRERLKLEKSVELVLTQDGVLIRNSEYELKKKKVAIKKKQPTFNTKTDSVRVGFIIYLTTLTVFIP